MSTEILNTEINPSDFWYRVKTLLKLKKIRQTDFSVRLGFNERAINNWISNNAFPDVAQAYKIAVALGVTVDWLVSGYDRIEEMDSQLSEPVTEKIEKWAAATTEIMREDAAKEVAEIHSRMEKLETNMKSMLAQIDELRKDMGITDSGT